MAAPLAAPFPYYGGNYIMTSSALKAPFPWFGGKRKVAKEVWTRFGAVRNFR